MVRSKSVDSNYYFSENELAENIYVHIYDLPHPFIGSNDPSFDDKYLNVVKTL